MRWVVCPLGCGFMFVVNLCSLPLSYFVRVFLFFFLCLSFHPTLFRFFLQNFFFFSYSPSFFLSSVAFLCVVLFASFVSLYVVIL